LSETTLSGVTRKPATNPEINFFILSSRLWDATIVVQFIELTSIPIY
jgi:hypothetical protein